MNTPHAVIVGAGFGGLNVARHLAKAPVRITLINRENYHLFQPLLYQVAIAGLLPSQIAYPLRTIFRRQKNITFQMGEVTGIDFNARYVKLNGSVIAYDYLVIAVGAETNYFGMEAVERNAFQVKDIRSAALTRNHLLKLFDQASHEAEVDKRRAMLTFVVAGGGPSGVETAGALAELVTRVMAKDFPLLEMKEARIILLESNDHLISAYPHQLRHATFELLQGKNVEIRLNSSLVDFHGRCVTLSDGSEIATHTLVAIQQGKVTAQNIQRMISGQAPRPFHYKDLGLLATIGRNAAVAHIWGISFSGFIAWVVWVFLHLYRLIGFRNRILVFINWAWNYIFYENQIRLITREQGEK